MCGKGLFREVIRGVGPFFVEEEFLLHSIRIPRECRNSLDEIISDKNRKQHSLIYWLACFYYLCFVSLNSETMDAIIIKPKTEQEYSFVMEMLKRMRIKAEPVQTPGLPRTRQEMMEDISRSDKDIAAGRTITNSDLHKEIATWK